ncbi:MAG: 2-C-methyl-D-erythritol 4-phosphate cytidylyltransferase [Acidimicrobiales bacterium]
MAGGSGSRFGGPKQFLLLAGRPVAAWSVAAARTVADGVVLVVPAGADDSDSGAPGPSTMGADRVVVGGSSRAGSVRAGLAAVPEDAAVIVVHDAARPLATPALFAAVVDAVRSDGADGAIPVLPLSDTLKRTSEGRVLSTVDRAGLATTQTPQAFVAARLRAAHRGDGEATDDAGLLELEGATVRTVPGDPRNLKLTRAEDLAVAEALMAGIDR